VVTAGGAPAWQFEEGSDSPDPYEGAGKYILSGKRRQYAEYARENLESSIAEVSARMDSVQASMTYELHGSGTTNPSKLFWKVMDRIEQEAKVPLFMTYRAVGSSTGQKEFVGQESNGWQSYNHFGSGDIPMTADRYNSLTAAGGNMVHVPFALGAIGFFHSVPADVLPTGGLKLTACLLSKIFQRRITTWDHADILADNPGLSVPAGTNIRVVHRNLGSSSTAGATEYMKTANEGESDSMCVWDQTTGSTSNWAADTYGAAGSDGVSNEIDGNAYSIGYIDAGHGHNLGLGEVSLQNLDGNYLTTKEADIGAAATVALANNDLPTDPADSWAEVNLYNKPGATTWPITMISYFYIRRDLSAYGATGTLLKAFVEYVLTPTGQAEATEFMFFPLPAAMLTYNAATMAGVVTAGGAPAWQFEEGSDSPDPYEGSGTFILSGKRGTYADYHRRQLEDTIETMQAAMADMELRMASGGNVVAAASDSHDDVKAMAVVGLVFGLLGFILGGYNTFQGFKTGAIPCAAPTEQQLAKHQSFV